MSLKESIDWRNPFQNPETQVVEVSLALPPWLFLELQKSAAERNLTVAQLLRGLAGQFTARVREKAGASPLFPDG